MWLPWLSGGSRYRDRCGGRLGMGDARGGGCMARRACRAVGRRAGMLEGRLATHTKGLLLCTRTVHALLQHC